jgi:hypothetical protein
MAKKVISKRNQILPSNPGEDQIIDIGMLLFKKYYCFKNLDFLLKPILLLPFHMN